MLREIVQPYLLWIKLGVVAAVLALAVRGGCSWQARRDHAVITSLKAEKSARDVALGNAARVLRSTAQVLRDVDEQSAERIAESQREARELAKAGQIAMDARAAAERRAAQLAADIEEAKRKRPGCPALMGANLEAVCGISPR